MLSKGKLKQPFVTLAILTGVLMLALSLGFTVGLLSNDPDGLEKTLIDGNGGGEEGETWIEDLPSFWNPPLEFIANDYIIGIIGIAFSFILMIGVFRLRILLKKKTSISSKNSIN